MAEPTGLAAVMGEAIDAAGAPELQSSLFPAERLGELANLDRQALKQRSAGRPKGALNKRTEAFRDYVLARAGGQHPVDGLIEAYMRPVHVLALELGCTALQAFEAQQNARRIVLEYVEGKMPVRVSLEGQAGIQVVFEGFAAQPGATIEGEFFQALSVDQTSQSDGKKSDSEA